MSLLQRRRKKPSVNIIPLMDVLTILIFFFLVSMQFKEMTTLNLTLPDIESAGQNEFSEKVTLSIDAEGVVQKRVVADFFTNSHLALLQETVTAAGG